MKEIKYLRGPREKHFIKSDGSMVCYLYDRDVHYLKNKKYVEIDNRVVENNKSFKAKASRINPVFKKERKGVEINEGKNSFYMEMASSKTNNDDIWYLDNKINYRNILDNVDLNYLIENDKLKEEIILKEYNKSLKEISFRVDTNYKLKLNDDKSISIIDNEKIKYIIDAPFMIDSNGNYNNNIYYMLDFNDNKYTIKLILDTDWLGKSNIKYPVVIDPTISVNSNKNIVDTYISSLSNVINGVDEKLKIGVNKNNNKDEIFRTLIKFDLPSIATGSIVTNATLNLVSHKDDCEEAYTNSPLKTDIHEITQNWSEATATWDNMSDKYNKRIEDSNVTWKTIKTELDKTHISYSLKNSSFNVTNLVKQWYSGKPNYGVMLKKHTEEYIKGPQEDNEREIMNYAEYYSKNHNETSVNPTPMLIIEYKNQNGLEEYYSYDKVNLSNGGIYINRNNGNLITNFALSTTVNGKMPSSVSLYYNTNDFILNKDLGYGKGYKLNYNQTIKEDNIDESDYLEYLDADGTLHYFRKNDDNNAYVDEDGLGLTATLNNNDYIITDKDSNKMRFIKNNDTWYLSSITNTSNDTITITYTNNKISKITDANNEEINIEYLDNSIKFISKNDTTILNYVNNKLSNISNKTGTISIVYDEKDLIKKIIDIDNTGYGFIYYDVIPYRLNKILELGIDDTVGNSLMYEYGFDYTTITDNKGRINTYCFNENGSSVSMSSLASSNDLKNGYGKTCEYYTYGGERNNKLTTDNQVVKYVNNLIPNSSFEEENTLFISDNTTVVRTSEFSNSGNNSLKVVVSDTINGNTVYANMNVLKDKYYTFSTYVKGNGSIKLDLSYEDIDGNIINSNTSTSNNEEFTRYDVTIFYKNDAKTPLKISISGSDMDEFLLDDMQLEEGEVANYYNMIENSDFSNGINGWIIDNDNYQEISKQDEIITLNENNKAYMLKCDPNENRSLKKSINIKGKENDTYNLSFWYKNTGIKVDYETSIYGNYNLALIRFKYLNGYPGEPMAFELKANTTQWQFFSYNFVARKDYEGLDLNIIADLNVNEVYVTNFALYKDLGNTTYVYDDNGNLINTIGKSKEIEQFKYDKNNQLISSFDPLGNNLKYEYDKSITNRLLGGISPTGINNKIRYDEFNNPIKTTIRNTYVDLEKDNNLVNIRTYGSDRYLTINNQNKNIVALEDNCSNDIWQIEKIDNNLAIKHHFLNKYINISNNKVVLSDFNASSSLFNKVDCDNGSVAFVLNNTKKYLTINNNVLDIKQIDLDDMNVINNDNTLQFYLENTLKSNYIEANAIYSENGKVITKTIDSLDNVTNYDIDEDNGRIKKVTDANGTNINYTYDIRNRLSNVNVESMSVDYTYNDNNMIETISTGNKNYNFLYDNFLNKAEISIGNKLLIMNNYEENNGNLLSSIYGNGHIVKYKYDEMDRLKTVENMDDVINYRYNNLGNLAKVYTNNDLYKYNYDFAKRLSRYSFNNYMLNYTYDKNNNISKKKYRLEEKEEEINYQINSESAVEKISLNEDNFNYSYDDLGRLESININDNYNKKYKYVTRGNKTSMLIEKEVIGNDEYTYKYDKLNNIREIRKNNKLFKKYKYNGLNELVSVDDYENNISVDYTYDSQGNIVLKKEYEVGTKAILNKRVFRYENSAWEDQLTSYDDKEITYDAIGNPLTIGSANLTWINGRSLSSYVDNSKNLNISYKYDKDGIRKEKQVNDDVYKYYVEGNKIILETRNNNVIYYIRDEKGNLLGFKYNNELYYYITNIQGDIVGILNSNYQEIAHYSYDSYGKLMSIKDINGIDVTEDQTHIGNINPFRYRGYYYDNETSLYYLNSRYYNPDTGRFINADGIIGSDGNILSYNLYLYTGNKYIGMYDENGDAAEAAALLPALGGVGVGTVLLGIGLSALAYILLREVMKFAVNTVTDIVDNLDFDSKPKKKDNEDEKKYTVYRLINPIDKKTEYVGRTNNIKKRTKAHQKSHRGHLILVPLTKQKVDYNTARGLEQYYIVLYGTLNRANKVNNQINGIRWGNPNREKYMDAAAACLADIECSETYVGG